MTIDAFLAALADPAPPPGLAPALLALWWDGKQDWARAHDVVADEGGAPAAWVHAYLHRREGDDGNARYWYGRAGQPMATGPLEPEWCRIAAALLGAD